MTDLVRLLMICLAAASACFAEAGVVRWLYDVEVQVASQSEAERRRAGRVALSEVLRRVTGMAELPAHPDLAAALRTPDQFYSRYEFASRKVADAADEDMPPATFLAIEFEPRAVLGLLRRAALPVWAANRPTVHAWVAVQRDAERELIAANANVLAEALARRSRQRGLELSLPLMDMEDLDIAASDVWGLFWERIERASARYGADLLLVGRVRQDADGSCAVDWHLRSRAGAPGRLYDIVGGNLPRTSQGFDETFEQQAQSAEAAARAGLDSVADALASRFAVHGELAALAVVVRGIDTVSNYAALLRYLRSREYIERIEIRVAQHDALALRLHSRSGPEQLRELLALGGQLGESAESGAVAGALELSWQGGE